MNDHAQTERIAVRISPAQKAALERIANGRGCQISDLAREAMIAMFALPVKPLVDSTPPESTGKGVMVK
jgi:hypothetical protein